MAAGKIVFVNPVARATLSGHQVAPLVLDNLKTDRDYVGRPWRCTDCTDLAKSRFEVLLDEPQLIDMVALLFHTMSRSARYRITFAEAEDAAYAAPLATTGWRWVYPSLYDPLDQLFGVENFWDGALAQSVIDLAPQHLFAPVDEVLAGRFLVELDDQLNPRGFFDVGGMWAVSMWSPTMNFERGRELNVLARDLIDEAASGRRFGERRTPRRSQSITYAMLKDDELRRFIDAGMAVTTTGTVLFVPDVDDPAAMAREAFPATFSRPPGGKFTYQLMNSTAFTLEEILA